MKTLGKKIISMVLLLSMLLSTVPVEVLAANIEQRPHAHAAVLAEPGGTPGLADEPCEKCRAEAGEIHKPHCEYVAEYCNCQSETVNEHDSGCPMYIPKCNCKAAEGEDHKPGCEILTRKDGCRCVLGTDTKHRTNCPLHIPECDCGATVENPDHKPGCDMLKYEGCICSLGETEHRIGCKYLEDCTCAPGASEHAPTCPLHQCNCTCKVADGEAHKPGCEMLVHLPGDLACTCALGTERHGQSCPRYQDEGCTCGAMGYGTPHTNACDLRYALCKCGTDREDVHGHKDGCPLYEPQCDCEYANGTGEGEDHTADCAVNQPICTCGASSASKYHAYGCPLYVKCSCTVGSNDTKYHDPGCVLYVKCTCGAGNQTKVHASGCILYIGCDCGVADDNAKYHEAGCSMYMACTCTMHSNDTKYHLPTCVLYTECIPACGAGIDSREHLTTCPLYVGCTCGAAAGIPHDPMCPRYLKPCTCGAPKNGPHAEGCARYNNEIVQPGQKTLQALINEADMNNGFVQWHTAGSNIYEDINVPVTKQGLVVDLNGAILHPAAVYGRAAGTGLTTDNVKVYGDVTFRNGTIDGSGLGNSRGVMVYSGASFTAGDNLTIQNFNVSGSGGGIRVDKNASLEIHANAHIEHNAADDLGGGVYIYDGTKLILDANGASICNNTADYGGGLAMYSLNRYIDGVEEGGEYLGTLENLTLDGNKANKGGGGLYVSSYTYVNFVNLTLTDNESDVDGGGAYFAANVDIKFTGLNASGNTATDGYGGALYVSGWSGASKDADNKAVFINPSVCDNSAKYAGAVHFLRRAEVSFIGDANAAEANRSFSRNVATGGAGGALSFATHATIKMQNIVMDHNEAFVYGGAMYIGGRAILTLDDNTISNNIAYKYGGGIAITSGDTHTVTMNSGLFKDNRVFNSKTEWDPDSRGGGIYINGSGSSKFTMNGGTFDGNRAGYYGGGLRQNYGYTYLYTGLFENNRTDHYDGAGVSFGGTCYVERMPLAEDQDPATQAPRMIFRKNVAARRGGAISGGTLYLNDALIEENTGNGGGGAIGYGRHYINGGLIQNNIGSPAIYTNTTMDLNGGEITGNSGTGVGTDSSSTININANPSNPHNGVWIHDNKLDGVYLWLRATVNMKGGVIENNARHGIYGAYSFYMNMNGGIIRNNGEIGITNPVAYDTTNSYIKMTGGTITGNRTRGINACQVAVSGGEITNNGSGSVDANGGGIWGHKVEISGGTITGNSGTYGGGIYVSEGTWDKRTSGSVTYLYRDQRSYLTITGGTVQDNSARFLGNDVFATTPLNKELVSDPISSSSNGSNPTERKVIFEMAASGSMTDPQSGETYTAAGVTNTSWQDELEENEDEAYLANTPISSRRHTEDDATRWWEAYTFTLYDPTPVAQIGEIQYRTLQDAFKAIEERTAVDVDGEPCGDIFMLRDTTENVQVPSNITATLDLRGKTVRCAKGTVLTMNGGTTLEIKDTTKNALGKITGATTSGIVVRDKDKLTLSSGNVCNNINNTIGEVNTISNGGGIRVENGGLFILKGTGNIHDNTAPINNAGGGGVAVLSGGKMIMEGGIIEKNGALKLSGGTGTNADGTNGRGGGVYVLAGGEFTLNDGILRGNLAPNYDGAAVQTNGIFTMNGGLITGNKAGQSNVNGTLGGAVGVNGKNGIFTMNGGEISENIGNWGGGVIVWDAATFIMNDGVIKNNNCPNTGNQSYGGGVAVWGNNTAKDDNNQNMLTRFIMNGGSIEGNKAANGGGVCMRYQYAYFEMNDGSITGNTAVTGYGGGVYTYPSDNLNGICLKGGTITGNTSKNNGGGIFVGRSGTFELMPNGTTVYNNTAASKGGNDIFFNLGDKNNQTVVKTLTNPGTWGITDPLAYDSWLVDTIGEYFKSDKSLADIANAAGWTDLGNGSWKVPVNTGFTAAIAKEKPTHEDGVAYYIPAGKSLSEDYIIFPTLQAAIDEVAAEGAETDSTHRVPSGGTIYLMADFPENVTVSGKKLTLDMNGHTLTGAAAQIAVIDMKNGAELIVTDTEETTLTIDVPGPVYEDGTTGEPTQETITVSNYMHKVGGTGTMELRESLATGQGIALAAGDKLTIQKCVLQKFSTASRSGSAIYNLGGEVILEEGTVLRDNAYTGIGDGGAVYINTTGKVTVNGGLYENNTSVTTGGVFRLTGVEKATAVPTLTINAGTFKNNSALNGGVIAAVTNSKVEINGGEFKENFTTGTNTADSNDRNGMGGVLYVYSAYNSTTRSVVNINAGTFTGNEAKHGGVIYTAHSLTTLTENTHSDTNTAYGLQFKNNKAVNGGVMFIGRNDTGQHYQQVKINGGLYDGNTASTGGVIYIHANNLEITDGEFCNNTVTGAGGVLYRYGWDNSHIRVKVSGGKFHDNEARQGGVIYNASGNVQLTGDAELYKNTGSYTGGAIEGTTVLSGTVNIHDNYGRHRGGGIYGTVTMQEDEAYTENWPEIHHNKSGSGGGTYGAITMDCGSIHHNTATGSGGGICSESAVRINGGEIAYNTANSAGGGIYGNVWATVIMNDGSIHDNTAGTSGGGICNVYYYVRVYGGEIYNNKAGSNGGGVYSAHHNSSAAYNITDFFAGGRIYNNYAGGNGGGIYFSSQYALGHLRVFGDMVITGNRAGGYGGGVYNNYAGTKAGDATRDRTEIKIGFNEDIITPAGGAVYGNSAGLGQDFYSVSGSENDIVRATDMNLPPELHVNGWLDETTLTVITTPIHQKTNRFYALTLDYTEDNIVAVVPLRTPAEDGSTVKEFKTVQDAITELQLHPELYDSAFRKEDGTYEIEDTNPTVILVADVVENVTVPSDVKMTLDLNHHSFSGQGTAITVLGEMDIRDEYMDDEKYNGRFRKVDSTDSTKVIYEAGSEDGWGVIQGGSGTTGGGLKLASGGKVTMYDGHISNCRATNGGSGVYIASGTFILDGGTIDKNTSPVAGAAVYVDSSASNFIMRSGLVANNKDGNNNGYGTIYNNGGSITISGGVISDNVGNAAVYNNSGKLNISGGTFNNNTNRFGTINVNNGTAVIDGGANKAVLITENTSTLNGGALYVNAGTTFLSNVQIVENEVKYTGTDTSYGKGGGVYHNGGTLIIAEGTEIEDNKASYRGGGIYQNGGTMTMIGGQVIGNQAPIGGGIAQTPRSASVATVSEGVKVYANKSMQSAAGNDIYSAYEGTGNWETLTGSKSKITLEAVPDMNEPEHYNVWRDDTYEGDAFGTAELLGEGMYITGNIRESNNLQLTTYYFDQESAEDPVSQNYRIGSLSLLSKNYNSGSYPTVNNGSKVIKKTAAELGWPESQNTYIDPTTGVRVPYRVNPYTREDVLPSDLFEITTEKKASEMGWPMSDQTYMLTVDGITREYNYLVAPDGTLYEQNEMVDWEPGDDCSRKNTLVLTNDTVSYAFDLTLERKVKTEDALKEKVRVWVEIELPNDLSEAELSTATITEGNNGANIFKGYVTTREENGKIIQVMRGYAELMAGDGDQVGGSFNLKVKDMCNGDKLKPTIRTWIEGDMDPVLDDNGEQILDSEGKPVEEQHVLTTHGDRLTVSATGRYNLSLLQNTGMIRTGYFNTKEGTRASKSEYEDGVDGVVYGTMLGYGLTVMLYNDPTDVDKGIKGIELPKDGLEFDVSLRADLFLEGEPLLDENGNPIDMTPIFWAGKENELGKYGRPKGSTLASFNMNWNDEDDAVQNTPYAWNAAPFNSGNSSKGVYNGGGWNFTVNKDGSTGSTDNEAKIHVRVNGYTFNITGADDITPSQNSDGNTSSIFNNKFTKAFTAGYIQILYPFEEEAVKGMEGFLTIESKTAAHNLSITTESGVKPIEAPGIGNLIGYFGAEGAEEHATNEMHYEDNYVSSSNGMFIYKDTAGNGDIISAINFFRTATKSTSNGKTTFGYGNIDAMAGGEGVAPLGTMVTIGSNISFQSKIFTTDEPFVNGSPNPYYIPDDYANPQLFEKEEYNYITAVNSLQKIDADAFTVVGGEKIVNQKVTLSGARQNDSYIGKSVVLETVNGAVVVRTDEELPTWGSTTGNNPYPTTSMRLTVLYAAKPNGQNWDKVEVTAQEMLDDSKYLGKYRTIKSKEDNTTVVGIEYDGMEYGLDEVVLSDGGIADMNKYHEEQLLYFETLDDLNAYFSAKGISDPKCVGVLFQARDTVIRNEHNIGFEVITQITNEFEKTGKTYATTSDWRTWSTYRPDYRLIRGSTEADRMEKLYDFDWDNISYTNGSVAKGLVLQNADGTPDQRTFCDTLDDTDPTVQQRMPGDLYYYAKTGTNPNRYMRVEYKDSDGNPILDANGEPKVEYRPIPEENTRHPLKRSAERFCSGNIGSTPGVWTDVVPYIKTEYAYGSHKGGTHNSWKRGNSLLVHTLRSTIGIVVADKINEESNAAKEEYNLSMGDHTARFKVDPQLLPQSEVNNAMVTDGSQSTKAEVVLTFPVGLTYNPDSIAFDYTADLVNGVPAPTYKEGELTWEIGEVTNVYDDDGNLVGTQLIATTYVPDVSKRLPKIEFATTISDFPERETTTLTMRSSIRATYEEYNAMAALPSESSVDIRVIRSQMTGIYHDVLKMPLDPQPGDSIYSTLVEIGEDFGFELTYYNNAQNETAHNVRMADILPYNNDGRNGATAFDGGYTVKKIQVTFEGPNKETAAANFMANGKLVYGGRSQSAEKIASQNTASGLTRDEKISIAYNDMLGNASNPGLFDEIIDAGLGELLNSTKVNKGTVGSGENAKCVVEFDISSIDMANLAQAVKDEYLSKLPEDAEKPSGEALDAAIRAALKEKLGMSDADLAGMGLTTLYNDTTGHLIFVDFGDVAPKTVARVNIVLNGGMEVPELDADGNPVKDENNQPKIRQETGGNYYINGFASNTNDSMLKSQKGKVTVVQRKLTGFAFLDMNHDGRFTSGIDADKKLAGIEVWLYKVQGEQTTLATDVTGKTYFPLDEHGKPTPVRTKADGSYTFNNVGPGDYIIEFTDSSGKKIDEKMKWEDMSVTCLAGDDGNPGTKDPFETNSNMNRCVPVYETAASGSTDTGNTDTGSSDFDENGTSTNSLARMMALANEDHPHTTGCGCTAANSAKLKYADLYAKVGMPRKDEMITATVNMGDNNLGLYCIEAQVEKQWTGMVDEVPEDSTLSFVIEGAETGYKAKIDLQQGSSYGVVNAGYCDVVDANGEIKVTVNPDPLSDNTALPDFTWTSTTFYLTAETWDAAAQKTVPVNYTHSEIMNLTGYDEPEYDKIVYKTTGITKFIAKNHQRSHDMSLLKLDFAAMLKGQDSPLQGAKFRFKQGNEVFSFYKDSEGVYHRQADNVNYSNTVQDLEVDADGMLKVTGLPEGTVILKETKAPKGGYMKASGEYVLTIDKDGVGEENIARTGYTARTDERVYNGGNEDKLTLFHNTEVNEYTDAAGRPVVEVTHYFKVPNVKSFLLPKTGGEGIAVMLVTGMAVSAAGLLLLLEYRKRRKNQNLA